MGRMPLSSDSWDATWIIDAVNSGGIRRGWQSVDTRQLLFEDSEFLKVGVSVEQSLRQGQTHLA